MQKSLFTVAKLEDFVLADHPLRAIRALVSDALTAMNTPFNVIYADSGRDSIVPEKLIRVLLLQVFYSIRSERQLCEQLRYNLLFRWFVGVALGADKAYDTTDFVAACRERKVTPHVAANVTRRGGSAIEGRTTSHPGYLLNQIVRKRIEEHFGWGKTFGRIRQTVFRGLQRVGFPRSEGTA